MAKAILDTSFILSCARQKIDFFDFLESEGFEIIIPHEVVEEIRKISASEKKMKFRKDAGVSVKVIGSREFEEIKLGTKSVDSGIIKFAKENPKAVVGTLDREMKSRIKNRKIVVRGKKKLEII